MQSKTKEIIRFSFDCPTDIHTTIKMKATFYKKTVRDYLLNLIAKDLAEDTPCFISNEDCHNQLKMIFKKDDDLMKGLANR